VKSLHEKLTAEKNNAANLDKQKTHLQQQIINIKEKNINFGSLSKKDQTELQRLKDLETKYIELQEEFSRLEQVQKADENSLVRLTKMQMYLERVEQSYNALQVILQIKSKFC
jgi:chromosome segregation ATPase